MAELMEIQPSGPVHGSIRPPGSKSITNRALVCAALAEGESTAHRRLGQRRHARHGAKPWRNWACTSITTRRPRRFACGAAAGGFQRPAADLFVANSGTSMRFLTPLVALGQGTFRLDGTPRMRQRPIEDLLDALRQLGVDARSELANGCPPVIVRAAGLPGGKARVAGNISSQFLSGLLMAAPYAARPVELLVAGELVSKPYVEMTLAVMAAFGVARRARGPAAVLDSRPASGIAPAQYAIEPDASAASYFFAAAAVTGGEVTVEGLSRDSLQGDVAFCECLARMGCEVRYGPDSITVARQAAPRHRRWT